MFMKEMILPPLTLMIGFCPSLCHPWTFYAQSHAPVQIQWPTCPCPLVSLQGWRSGCRTYRKWNEITDAYLGQYSSHSSNSWETSLRKTFLHFLHARIISGLFIISWSSVSKWHSGQSNHFLQHEARICTWAFRMCLHISLFEKFKFNYLLLIRLRL